MLLTRAALILCVPIMLAYGCAGLVYGELPMLTPFGFVEMPGACAWLTAAMAFALAVLATDWLVRGELATPRASVIVTTRTWRVGDPPMPALPPHVWPQPRSSPLRIACLGIAAVACASALVGRVTLALGSAGLRAAGWTGAERGMAALSAAMALAPVAATDPTARGAGHDRGGCRAAAGGLPAGLAQGARRLAAVHDDAAAAGGGPFPSARPASISRPREASAGSSSPSCRPRWRSVPGTTTSTPS
ncbi:hypothetical protein [Variovorax sp. UC122_21]|uniref:hypothetical protein n=1 Tax=Variovorax sp. UC122_21 TaxID=3374554 RepID=UPI003756CE14